MTCFIVVCTAEVVWNQTLEASAVCLPWSWALFSAFEGLLNPEAGPRSPPRPNS